MFGEVLELGNNLLWSTAMTNYTNALTPGCKPWLRRRKRWMLGQEKLNLQCIMHKTYCSHGFSQSQLADLAGNAVNNLCWGVVLFSALATLGQLRAEGF